MLHAADLRKFTVRVTIFFGHPKARLLYGRDPMMQGRNRESIYKAGAGVNRAVQTSLSLELNSAVSCCRLNDLDQTVRHRVCSIFVLRQESIRDLGKPGRDQSSIRAPRPIRTTSFCSGARPEQTGGPIRRSATRIRARFPPGTPRVSTSEPELVVINLVS